MITQFVERGGIGKLCSLLFECEDSKIKSISAKGLLVIAKRSKIYQLF